MPTVTVRLSRSESARVASLAKKKRVTRSEIVREALTLLEEASGQRTALDDLSELVGDIQNAPRDLATNPKHLKGFGR